MLLSSLLLPLVVRPQAADGPKLRLIPGISEERLYDLEESRDGTRLVTNSVLPGETQSRAPRLWDAKRMRVLAVLALPGADRTPVEETRFSMDGRTVVTRAQDGFRVWDAKTGKALLSERAPEGTSFGGAGVAPDAKSVVAALGDGRLLQWTLGSKEPPRARALAKPLAGLGYSYSGKTVLGIALQGKDGVDGDSVMTWSAETLEPIQSFPVVKAGTRNVNFTRDDRTIAITDYEGKVHVFDAETAKPLFEADLVNVKRARDLNVTVPPDTYERAYCRFAANDASLIVAEKDGTLDLLDSRTGVLQRKLAGAKGLIREIRTSADGNLVAAIGLEGEMRVWNLAKGTSAGVTLDKDETLTAAEFSPDLRTLWVGTGAGRLLRLDANTGKILQDTSSATQALTDVRVFANGNFALAREVQFEKDNVKRAFYQTFRPENPNSSLGYLPTSDKPVLFSPDGKRAAVVNPHGVAGVSFVNVATHRMGQATLYSRMTSALWEPKGKWVIGFFDEGDYAMYDGLTFAKNGGVYNLAAGGVPRGSDVSPDGKVVATCGLLMPTRDPANPKKEYTVLWDPIGQKKLFVPTSTTDKAPFCRFSPDGKWVAVKDENFVEVFDVATAKRRSVFKLVDDYSTPGKSLQELIYDMRFTPDGNTLVVPCLAGVLYTVDLAAPKPVPTLIKGVRSTHREDNWTLSRDGLTALNFHRNGVEVWNLATRKVIAHMDTTDRVTAAAFTPDERRVLTTDPVDGMVVWSFADHAAPKRLGALVFGAGKEMLALDADGRYDANDPAAVESASYVMAWSGGLETVDVAQMKSRFYEPGLFAKLMGVDPEPRRAVPDVATLKIYPEVRLTPKDGKIGVGVTDRDDGGTGTVEVFVNGKRILAKKGSGFFTFDPAQYRAYLIPALRLRPGERNELRVVAGNEGDDLRSPPAVAEIPLPDDLKAPPAKLYALCVGAGNYVGTKGDLLSPPSDAKAIGDALRKVSPRLLAGVEVTVLTTEAIAAPERPTRANILRWFEETAKKANSGDVVMVFIAGHGTNRIGEKSDYYFLTPDCDPGDVGPAQLGVATISGEDLRTALAKIPAAKQVVVLDTCHSGAASKSLLISSRSLAGDYGRAYESIREASGTWVLAGSASDQLSYESSSVDHGMLTYALLEAIDRASPEGLRKTESGELFVDVESWLKYAVNRVESLKVELDLPGVQQPELRSSTAGGSFDVGATSAQHRGELGLPLPRPVVIVGGFSGPDDEDPLHLEKGVGASLLESKKLKPWFDVSSHPGAYRVKGTYTVNAGVVALRLVLQKFDAAGDAKTVATLPLKGTGADLPAKVRAAVEAALSASKN